MSSFEKQLHDDERRVEQPKDYPVEADVDDLMRAGMTREEAEEEIERRKRNAVQKIRQAVKRDTDESPQM
ncbi:MAG: hypothetical protein A2934_04815 [Candidatus Sungbacteria bacterium RIFCSPLOWO2_01_FULL_47_10]|uniref:Uncharacterized protein n=1 Tax=Candidatus Sungbacteria bacterium RIFCSPLOWO2_01_FULL_47_10 TaxID=1802276 RepID=A0A1G2KZS5_9BACT|nr:MAG: hypothetical protein A2934_04815 [Candidatus Sungbacteria bacterium RIFCSPLOWO2_01_FULL_47_10]